MAIGKGMGADVVGRTRVSGAEGVVLKDGLAADVAIDLAVPRRQLSGWAWRSFSPWAAAIWGESLLGGGGCIVSWIGRPVPSLRLQSEW